MKTHSIILTPILILILVWGGYRIIVNAKRWLHNTSGDSEVVSTKSSPEVSSAEIMIAPVSSRDHILGDARAAITLVEFSDLDCPFCAQFDITMRNIIREYEGRVRWVYRHFPIPELHPEAFQKAEGAECVFEQAGNDGFWKYVNTIFEQQETLATLNLVVENLGFDPAAFSRCLASGKYSAKVHNEITQALAAGATGTPYSVILVEDQQIPVQGALSYEQLSQILENLLP